MNTRVKRTMKTAMTTLLVLLFFSGAVSADQTIEEVQRVLKDGGFYYGAITGEKNADTTAAIRRYQIRNGLAVSGDLDNDTLRAIKATPQSSVRTERPASIPTPATANGSVATGEARDQHDDSARVRDRVEARNGQSFGSEGDRIQTVPRKEEFAPSNDGVLMATPYEHAPPEVQQKVVADAQRILAHRGLFKSEIDGVYSAALQFSLRAYQSRVGLPASGRLDLETLAALELLPRVHTPVFNPGRPVGPVEPAVRGEWVRP